MTASAAPETSARLAPWTDVALGAVLAGLGALVYGSFFGEVTFVAPVLGAAAVPAVIVGATTRWGWPTVRIAAAAAVALVLYGTWALYPGLTVSGLPGPAALAAVGRAVSDGSARMLSVALPADADGDLLAMPVAVTWAASTASSLLAARGRSPLWPVVPPTLALGVALVLVAARDHDQSALTAAFAVVGMGLVLVRANRRALADVERVDGEVELTRVGGTRRAKAVAAVEALNAPAAGGTVVTPRGLGRRVLSGLPFVTVVGIAGALAGQALAPVVRDQRFDPRLFQHDRIEIDDTVNPLARLKAQLKTQLADGEPAELFHLELQGAPDGFDRLRIAVLDAYDGAQWTSTGTYRTVGSQIPGNEASRPTVGLPHVRQRVTITGLDGPFLPVAGWPLEVEGEDLAANSDTGVLVTPRRGLRGYSYTLESQVAVLGDEAVAAARPNDAGDLDDLRAPPPDVPTRLAEASREWATNDEARAGDGIGAELLTLRDNLRAIPYDDSASAEPGHSYGALIRALGGDPDDDGKQEGYAEQFAAAYALFGRERGVPTRVAVGYLLPEAEENGSYSVTEADAHAWPEVNLTGYGWVPIEPTDIAAIKAPNDDSDELPAGPGDAPQETGPVAPAPTGETAGNTDTTDPRSGVWAGLARRAAAVAGLALALLAVTALVVPLVGKPWQRRHRRRQRDPVGRILGAWQEATDRLTEHHMPVPPSLTVSETAELAAIRFGANGERRPVAELVAAISAMAPLVASAVYNPDGPTDEEAEKAWQEEATLRRAVRRGAGLRARGRARLDPRCLRPRWFRRMPALGRRPRAAPRRSALGATR